MSLSEQLGLLGRKVGMMRIFTDDGDAIPVTVLDVSNNRVTQVKTAATDGYNALQVAFGERKASRVTKPEAGHLAKAGVISVQHGSKGGMSIQRPYDQITLLEVVQACQGMFLPDFCDTPEDQDVRICTFHKAMQEQREATIKTLGKWRLANLVANPQGNIVGKTHPVCKMRFGDSKVAVG